MLCKIYDDDVLALLLMSKSKKMQESIRSCVFYGGVISEHGLYMCCVACVISAHGVAVTFAIALLLIFKSKNMQESIRLFVLSMDCICIVLHV